MIDVYRFLLALCVVQGHLLGWGAPWLAWQAVFSFYVLSGFLMTLVLNETYGFHPVGVARFAANRWLRLFPVYYVIIGLTAVHIGFIGRLDQLNASLALPENATEWLASLSIVTLAGFDPSQIPGHRLSPSAWSLAVELFCYGLLALSVAANPRRLILMLAVGIVLAAVQIVGARSESDYGLQGHYTVLQAGLIPFSVGGLAYFFRHMRPLAYGNGKIAVLGLLLIANVAAGAVSTFHQTVSGLYVAVLLNGLLIPILFNRPAKSVWQATLGGLAYPVFVSHWMIGSLVSLYVPNVVAMGTAHFLISTAVTLVFSWLLYRGVDRQIQRVRARVKRPPAALASAIPHKVWG